ncbi:conjugal transfer protein TraF [Pontiellaceae bacterium B12219]|nr:conjugal transfer protein TraF [Pontiellaceae bacterium B12219]
MNNFSAVSYKPLLFTLMLYASVSCLAAIDDLAIATTRGGAMGGADSAAVIGADAVYINPAALGFMNRSNSNNRVDNQLLSEQDFGWNFMNVGSEATFTGDLGSYLEALGGINFRKFERGTLRNVDNVRSLIRVAGALGNLNDTDTIVVGSSVGTTMQIGHFGTGFRAYGQVGGWINNLDLVNLGLDLAVNEIADELQQAGLAEGFPGGGTYIRSILTPDQQAALTSALSSVAASDAVDYIDAKLQQLVAEGKIKPGEVAGTVDTLKQTIEASGGVNNYLRQNNTSITGRGFIAVEIPISYGYAFSDNFSVGLTAKAIFGQVFGTQVWAFNDDNENILQDSLDSSHASAAFGIDAAMLYRIPNFQFALTGQNLNSPRFSGYSQQVIVNGSPVEIMVPDVTLDPQLTVGGAWIPFRRFALTTDYDLLETGTLLKEFNVQRLSFGSELDLSLILLRLGAYKNLAESDVGWVLTGGLGFQAWALSVDLAAAVSIEDTVEYDGINYPRTAMVQLSIGLDF